LQGCLYTNETCPPIEFIRVDPGPGKGLPFYLSTTSVTVGLVSAVLADATQSAPTASQSLLTLNPVLQPPSPGAHLWKFLAGKGIDLDPAGYLQYFRQAPTADLPMQQVTPQAALFVARDLGCRLPTSSEWQAAFAMASNPPPGNDPMKGFATVGWKLRDADFASLVQKATVTQHFPDDGIFLGTDPAQIPTGASADTWLPSTIRKMGGWTVADLKNDREGQRQMARLDESSSDFRSDLVDPPQMGFRPVGSTHRVFHDLVGNVAEYVLDTPTGDVESLPAGLSIDAKSISEWFSAANHLQQMGVIGGSFLSPPELDPMTRLPLPPTTAPHEYADVGFRLAFTDPKAYADVSLVIKSAAYLYAPAPPKPVDTAP
jgi:formylglycine-generating enzyme required for sulfatase activity